MKLFSKTLVAVGAVAVMGMASVSLAQTVGISTLPPGSINNVQTQAIAKVVQEKAGLQMRVVTYNSPAASMESVEVGEAAFSFMSNDEVSAALHGTQEYAGHTLPGLKLVSMVFPFKVGIVVRADSDIHTVADLKGKRFPIGWQGFTQGNSLSLAMLATGGLTFDDVEGVPTANLIRGADDLKAGKLDATIFAIGAPKMAELDAALGGIRFLDLSNTPEAQTAMAAVRPAYHIASQVALPHLKGVADGTNLMEYAMTIVAGDKTDDQLAYDMAKTLHDNKADLVAVHPSFGAMNPDALATPQPGIEYHPGAIRYYKEIGIWPAN